jgi:2-dehydro-3-deoxyphosphooctonate aldolase (KDO 8-P synthase)
MINNIPRIRYTDTKNFFLMAGPCAVEGEDMVLRIAERIVKISDRLQIPLIFKGSYRKANLLESAMKPHLKSYRR